MSCHPWTFAIDAKMDVTSEDMQSELFGYIAHVDLWWHGVPFDTCSRVREIPLPGPGPSPRPLRSEEAVRGVKGAHRSGDEAG